MITLKEFLMLDEAELKEMKQNMHPSDNADLDRETRPVKAPRGLGKRVEIEDRPSTKRSRQRFERTLRNKYGMANKTRQST